MFTLPTSFIMGGKQYNIRKKGDYRMVLDCFAALNDLTIDEPYRIAAALIIFYDGFNDMKDLEEFEDIQEAVNLMYGFFNCGQENIGHTTNYKLVDWEKDEMLIASAVNSVAGHDVRADDYMHWYTFMGYYMAVGECPLSNVVSIRHKIATGKKLEKYEKEFKKDNPEYFAWDMRSLEQKEMDELVKSLWNKE